MKGQVINNEGYHGIEKLRRLITLMVELQKRRLTIKEIAHFLDSSTRTSYRYLHLIEDLGIVIDKDFHLRYFIADDRCPICNKETIEK